MKKSVAYLTPFIEEEKKNKTASSNSPSNSPEVLKASPLEGFREAGPAKILLATVKGDVHDIGKNIVGVVLGCNGYDIIDLGVMVSADKILDTAKKENVEIIGLSGLITPSLDEMVHIAHEMKRRNMKLPLLIGGATTSRIHTAVKIAPQYDEGVVHVLDASRSVTVAGSLLNKDLKKEFLQNVKQEYIQLKENFESKRSIKQYLSYEAAVNNGVKIDWINYSPPPPSFTGTKLFEDFSLNELRNYIDWKPFFIAWEMHGNFPQILSDKVVGKEATKLYNDANALLDRIIKENWLTATGVIGFWTAVRTGSDTVSIYNDGRQELKKLEFLRQQIKKAATQPNLSLADFIKPVEPASATVERGLDVIGAFAVTIKGIETHIKKFEQQHDDYNKIILQALADRLVEAFAEYLHEKVRKEYWGYAKDEHLTNEELIKEKYLSIRPAPGYPACPDHTEKYKLFDLLNATQNTGIQLTESLAMYPAASVCGWYFSHPQSQYFGVGKIGRDQLENYAQRKGWSTEEAEKWLRPNLE